MLSFPVHYHNIWKRFIQIRLYLQNPSGQVMETLQPFGAE